MPPRVLLGVTRCPLNYLSLSNAGFAGSGGPSTDKIDLGEEPTPPRRPVGTALTKNLDAGGAAGLRRPRSKQEALRIHTNKRP